MNDSRFNFRVEKKPCTCPGFMGRPCTKFLVPPIINSVEGSVDEATADELIRRWNSFPELVRAAKRSMNWLSSYPGNGAMNAWMDMDVALRNAGERDTQTSTLPPRYLIGQRVIVHNRELGWVTRIAEAMIYVNTRNGEQCLEPKNVRPIPGGQL